MNLMINKLFKQMSYMYSIIFTTSMYPLYAITGESQDLCANVGSAPNK